MKRVMLTALISALLVSGAYAAKPVQNVSSKKHVHIAKAQKLVEQAFEQVKAAQAANEFDMNGHAKKASELLDQANAELKQAAEAANKAKTQ